MSTYIEHSRHEGLGLEVVDCTMDGRAAGGDGSTIRRVWVGSDGMNGRWLSHDEFRSLAAAMSAFAAALPLGDRSEA
jgi:hypothetical protein